MADDQQNAQPDPWAATFATTPAPAAAPPKPAPAPSGADPWANTFGTATPAPKAPPAAADPWAATFGTSGNGASTEGAKQEPRTFGSDLKEFASTPLLDFKREGAGPIERGVESFASDLTSPTSVILTAATLGTGAVEAGLGKIGFTAVEAAGIAQKAKLAADFGFLAKYGIDLGTNTIPQLMMNWGDYRAAKNEKDKRTALDHLEENATEATLGGIASMLATRGVAHDVSDIYAASPKGRAIANEMYANAIADYQEQNQVGTAQARQDFAKWSKTIPDQARRVAISRNIEAGGDPNVLERQALAAEANPATKDTAKEFRDAKQLSEEEIGVRDEMRNKLAANLAHLKYLRLLPEDGGLTNYLPHKWDFEDTDPETGKPITRTGNDGEREMLKKRTFATIAEGELKGAKPTTKDAAALISDYHERVSNLIAKHNLAEDLAGSYMDDGSPMAAPGHMFPGFTRGRDAPVSATEVANLKAAGKFDELLRRGRIYEVAGEPARTLEGGGMPEQTVKDAGGIYRGTKGGLVEVTLPPELAGLLPGDIDPRMREFVSVTLPEKGLTAESVQQALVRKLGEYGVNPDEPQVAQFLKATVPARPNYVWKQRDFVPSGLSVWRPVSEAEAKELPNAIVTYGKGPFPEQAIMEPGMRGIPTDQPERVAMARVPVLVNPDIAPHLEPVLETLRPKSALIRAALAVTKETKSDLLALSPFHWATILNRSLEAGLNPFGGTNRKFIFVPKDIDYYNLSDAQQRAIHAGAVVSSTRPGFSGYLEEGLAASHDSIINKIPLVGDFNRAIEGKLFGPHGWITSLKFDLFDKLSEEIRKSRPDLTADQADRVAASQVNNKFGGLNYTMMGRGASTQHTLRLMLLAPDFLESSGRSILDVAGNHGTPMLKSLVAFNAAHWLLARGINYLVSGNTHPESGFSVMSKNGKREYNLRTTLGDYLHFVEKPHDFLANRVNPIGVRAPYDVAAGEDPLGNKITGYQQFFDTLRQVTPIPLQGIYPTTSVTEPSAGDKLLQSVGVQSRKYFSPAETYAHQVMSRHGEGGEALEGDELAKAQLRYKLEDDLRTAINSQDTAGRIAATKRIDDASRGANRKISEATASEIIRTAHEFPMPLQATVSHLALKDEFDVWDRASLLEKRAIRPIIEKKIDKWGREGASHTHEQNESMRMRIQAWRRSLVE
jgi:hypothetical protein